MLPHSCDLSLCGFEFSLQGIWGKVVRLLRPGTQNSCPGPPSPVMSPSSQRGKSGMSVGYLETPDGDTTWFWHSEVG